MIKGLMAAMVLVFIVLCVFLANALISDHPGGVPFNNTDDEDMSLGVDIDVARLSGDSISIRVAGGDKLEEYQTGNPFAIMIGDADASNTSAIMNSGLSLNMTPGAGLMSGPGSSVIITGKEVTSIPYTAVVDNKTINRTDSTHVRVFGYHKNGVRICLMDWAV